MIPKFRPASPAVAVILVEIVRAILTLALSPMHKGLSDRNGIRRLDSARTVQCSDCVDQWLMFSEIVDLELVQQVEQRFPEQRALQTFPTWRVRECAGIDLRTTQRLDDREQLFKRGTRVDVLKGESTASALY